MASNANSHRLGDDADYKSLSRRERRLPRRTWIAFFTGSLLRLSLWYAIITALFRCPSSLHDLESTSPRLCKPYLQAKQVATPYVAPYYNRYAAGYVEAAKPYVKTFETRVYNPVSRQVEYVYVNYAAPRLVVAVDYAEQQWRKNGLPYLDRAQRQAQLLYDRQLGPYVNQVSGAVGPYATSVQETATRQYHTILIPLYEKSRPYLERAYVQGEYIMVEHVLPHSRKVGEVSYDFLATRLWPRLRVVYGENVEPQLAKIRERLANYREGKKLESLAESGASTEITATGLEVPLSSLSSAAESVVAAVTDGIKPETTTDVPPTTEEATLAPKEKAKLAEELKAFQDRFTKTSDKAADDLNERISEIVKEQIESQVQGTGQALLTELETTSNKQIDNLKAKINQIVSNLPEDATDNDLREAHEQAHEGIRKAGKVIKEKAQHLRSWKSKYIENVGALIKSATDSTLKVVDGIRDLGLQDIGMRWASMEDVSYKDWSTYHAEKTVDQWKIKIQNVATGHSALSDTSREAEEVETTGMGIAQDAAKELSRLKDVTAWKIDARDSSDDFSTKVLPAGAKKLLEKVKDKINSASEYVAGASPIADAQSAASSVSKSVVNPDASQKLASSVSSAAEEVSSGVSGQVSKGRKTAGSVVSNANAPDASSVSSQASEYVDSVSSLAKDAASSASSVGKVKAPVDPSLASQVQSSIQSVAQEARSSVNAEVNVAAGQDISASIKSAISEASAKVDPPAASKLSSSLESVISVASEMVDPPAASKASSKASKSAKEAASSASSAASSISSAAESVVDPSGASSAASSVSSDASKSAKKASKSLSDSASSGIDDASSNASSASSQLSSKASKSASTASSAASSAASSVSSSASEKAANFAGDNGAQKPLKAASKAASSVASSASSIASSASASISSKASDASSAISSSASSIASSEASPDDPNFHSLAALNLRSRAHSLASSLLSSAQSAASLASIETPGPSASAISAAAVAKAEQYGSKFVAAANEFAKKDPAEVTRLAMGEADEADGEGIKKKIEEVIAKATATT